MNLTRLQKKILGILVIFIAIRLLLGSLGLGNFSVWDLWPLLILYFGWRFWLRGRRLLGGFLLVWGGLFALDEWFFLSVDDLIGMLVAGVLLYFGYKLLRRRGVVEPLDPGAEATAIDNQPVEEESRTGHGKFRGWQDEIDRALDDVQRLWKRYREKEQGVGPAGKRHAKGGDAGGENAGTTSAYAAQQVFSPQESRSSLFGDFHLTSGRFELRNLQIWNGVGDVKIDLSRAVLPEAEALLVIDGWVGDVTIYVPFDLSVSVTAEVTLGDIDALGHRQGGINRRVMVKSRDYNSAVRRVNIIVSLIVGDIDVRYI